MFVGNVLVGLVAVAMIADDPRWLLFLPAALWLLQQTYGLRLRADDERRAWQAFAAADRGAQPARRAGGGDRGGGRRPRAFRRGPGRGRRAPGRRTPPPVHRRRATASCAEDAPRRPSRIGDDGQTLTRDPRRSADAQVGELRLCGSPVRRCPDPRERERARRVRRRARRRAARRGHPPRAAGGDRALVVRGGARPADRPGQPGGAAEPGRQRPAPARRTSTRWRCCCSTSTTSRRSTTPSGHAAGDELLR